MYARRVHDDMPRKRDTATTTTTTTAAAAAFIRLP
jgi:hypothetical protein